MVSWAFLQFQSDLRNRPTQRSVFAIPGESVPHLSRRSISETNRQMKSHAKDRQRDLPSDSRANARDQADSFGSEIRATGTRETESGNEAPDTGAAGIGVQGERLYGDRNDRSLRRRAPI